MLHYLFVKVVIGNIMMIIDAKEKINRAMMECEGITSGIHRFGGTEYKLGKREIGHIHGNYMVDIPFPLKIRNEIIENGEAHLHHILPESGWVTVYINNDNDIEKAVELLKRSYRLALEQLKGRNKIMNFLIYGTSVIRDSKRFP